MIVVDSHCHLMIPKFVEKKDKKQSEDEFLQKYSVDAIVERAHEVGVKYMLTIGTMLSDVDEIKMISDTHKNIFRSVGIHPQEAAKHCADFSENKICDIIKKHCAFEKTVAIGEIGLDYHFERESEPQQKKLFHVQLNLAEECNLPVVIHSRDASDDTISILKEHPKVQGVIHCFSGDEKFARESLDLDFFISMSGIITFKNAEEQRKVLKIVPEDKLLIETDSPFLAPVPFRGKINEPAFVTHVAEKIAEIKNVTAEKIAEQTTANFFRLFRKAKPE